MFGRHGMSLGALVSKCSSMIGNCPSVVAILSQLEKQSLKKDNEDKLSWRNSNDRNFFINNGWTSKNEGLFDK